MIRKKVLLVEPDYKSKFPPLPLLKFSTFFKKQGFQVEYINGKKYRYEDDKEFGEILITTLFTMDWEICIDTISYYADNYSSSKIRAGGIYASLLPEHIFKHTGIRPFVGCIKEIDECAPDYNLIPRERFNETSNVITSRGCSRKCSFCGTRILEPESRIIENWKNHFMKGFKHAIVHDNNILAHGDEHFFDVLDFFKSKKLKFMFDNGFDCRLFNKKHAVELKKSPIIEIRFAFDSMDQDGRLQNAIKLCIKAGIKPRNIEVFILYNFKDDLENALYRAREVRRMKARPFAMRYKPLNWLARKSMYVDTNWRIEDLVDFHSYVNKYWHMDKYSFDEWREKKHIILKRKGTRVTKVDKLIWIENFINERAKEADLRKDKESLFSNPQFMRSLLHE